MPAIDHPEEPTRCLVSGTELTHLGSAQNRQSMHEAHPEELTDSMKMFRWGVEGGRPSAGRAGTPPEWFYKGTGTTVRGHGESLDIPSHAEDGGEEAEIAASMSSLPIAKLVESEWRLETNSPITSSKR